MKFNSSLFSNFNKKLPIFSAAVLAFSFAVPQVAFGQAGNFGIGTAVPGSKLTVNGSFAATYKIINSNITLDGTDFYYAINASAPRTVTLPAATVAAPAAGNILGRIYHIKNTGDSTVTVAASGSELIDNQSGAGVASITLPAGYYAMLISKGTIGAVTTWEVALIGTSTLPEYLQNNTTLTSFIASSASPVILANSSNVFKVASAGPAFVSYSMGYDLIEGGTLTTFAQLTGDYVQFEIYVNNAASGIFVSQQFVTGTGGNTTIPGIVKLVAGNNTIDLRYTRTVNSNAAFDHSFQMASSAFSVYKIK